jgi:hypothetical protein
VSDADDQTGGSGDPAFDKPTSSGRTGKQPREPSPSEQDENDNDVVTDDDLPSGG